ncbi:MAG: DUF5994 family protein [Nocardioidaceae bacterium]
MTTSHVPTLSRFPTEPKPVPVRWPSEAGPAETTARVPLRLILSQSSGRGALDGAWWPQSRDLAVELADLVDHFPVNAGRIDHAVYSRPDWQSTPLRVAVARGSVKTGYFPADDTHLILLRMSTRKTLHVMVVPAELPPRIAELAMQTAAKPSNLRTAHEILRASRESENIAAYEQWSDDGGAAWNPAPTQTSAEGRRARWRT